MNRKSNEGIEMKHILFFLALLMAAPAWSKPNVLPADNLARTKTITINFAAGDTADTEAIAVSGFCSVRYQQASGDDASLYAVTTAATAASSGTLIAAFTASTTTATTFTAGTRWVKAVATDATAGGSVMLIDCSPLSGSTNQATQPDPSEGEAANALIADITDPSITKLGMGIQFGTHDSFAADPDSESDNQMGFFYNQTGVNGGGRYNQYEHAFDDSWETAFRATSGTSDRTWVERNYDFYPPDNQSTLTSINGSFNPAAGETVYFSGGGQGKVLSWSSPTLIWRQDFGSTAAGETVIDDDGTPSHTAVVGAPSAVTTYYSRFHQFEYDTLLNVAGWAWYSLTGDQTSSWGLYEQDDIGPAFKIGYGTHNGRRKAAVSVNANPQTSHTFTVQDSALFNNAVMNIKYISTGLDNLDTTVGTDDGWGGGSFVGLRYDVDLSATNTQFQAPFLFYALEPSQFGTGSASTYPQVIRINTQGGRGSNGGPVIHILPQTCTNGGGFSTRCATDPGRFGNLLFAGGNWNNGHVTFGNEGGVDSYEELEDHLFRDQTLEVLRISTNDAPDSETDANPIVTGTGSASHGVAMWGISNASGAATFTSGTEVCAAVGVALTCQDVIEFSTPATPTDSACATDHADGVKFMAMCY